MSFRLRSVVGSFVGDPFCVMSIFKKTLLSVVTLTLLDLTFNQRAFACEKNDLRSLLQSNQSRPVELRANGNEFIVSFVNSEGQLLQLPGKHQLEREIRLQIPSAVGGCFLNPGLSTFCYDNLDSLAINMMSLRIGPFRFEPLAGKQVDFHDNKKIRVTGSSVHSQQGAASPTRLISRTLPNGYEVESSFKARVGARVELSTYYDLPESTFLEHGIAVRIKRWYRPGRRPIHLGSSLFFKIPNGRHKMFTQRNEYHLPLPDNFKEEEIPKLILAMASEILPGLNLGPRLPEPLIHLYNQRIGFNLIFDPSHSENLQTEVKKPIQIGFVVLDQFSESRTPLDVSDWASLKKAEITSQMEIEIFDDPLSAEIMNSSHKEFEGFITTLGSRIPGTKIDNLPKVFSANRRLSRIRPRNKLKVPRSPSTEGDIDFYSDVIPFDGINYPYFASFIKTKPVQLFSGKLNFEKAVVDYAPDPEETINFNEAGPDAPITRIHLWRVITDNQKTKSLFFGSIEDEQGLFIKINGKWILFAVPVENAKKEFYLSHPTGRVSPREPHTLMGYKIVRPDVASIEFDPKNQGVGFLKFSRSHGPR